MKNLAGNLHAPPGAARNILSLRQTFSSTYTGRFPDMEFPLGGVRYAEVVLSSHFSAFYRIFSYLKIILISDIMHYKRYILIFNEEEY